MNINHLALAGALAASPALGAQPTQVETGQAAAAQPDEAAEKVRDISVKLQAALLGNEKTPQKLSQEKVAGAVDFLATHRLDATQIIDGLKRIEAASSREAVRAAIKAQLMNDENKTSRTKVLFESGYLTPEDATQVRALFFALVKESTGKKPAESINLYYLDGMSILGPIIGAQDVAPYIEDGVQNLIALGEYDHVLRAAKSYGKFISPYKMKHFLNTAIAKIEESGNLWPLSDTLDQYGDFFDQDEIKQIIARILPKLGTVTLLQNAQKIARYAAPEQLEDKLVNALSGLDGDRPDRPTMVAFYHNYRPFISEERFSNLLANKSWTAEDFNRDVARKDSERAEEALLETERRTQRLSQFEAFFK